MKKNIPIINDNGFSLLEITVVLIIISILLSAVIPMLSRSFLEKAANKTALDMTAIQEASRKFYIDNNQWPVASGVYPTPIAVLQAPANGYLPYAWSAINPFGASAVTPANYSYIVTSNASSLTVCTLVPGDAQAIIQNSLTTPYVDSNGNVCSSVSVPGASSVLPPGSILEWSSSILPNGFFWCNGQAVSRTTYLGLFAAIGTMYGAGDGSTTFNLPDARGRTIVGVDGMGGASPANRITQWSSAPAVIGGTFGEDAHRQSVTEMAPHTHNIKTDNINAGTPGAYPYNVGNLYNAAYTQGLNTDSSGGNGDGSGLGAPANVVQPSIAMGYIIKY